MGISSSAKAALLPVGLAICGCSAAIEPPPSPPVYLDINSEAFRRQMAEELRSAREIAQRSQAVVTRRFVVGWETHHGYYLTPIDNRDEWVIPDFADEDVGRAFDDFVQPGRTYPRGAAIPHLGKRLICECTGVEWSFHSSKRFTVRAARLEAI
jgi:hypothetical protein